MPGYAQLLNNPLLTNISTASFTGPTDVTSSTTQEPVVLPANFLKRGMVIHSLTAGNFSTTGTPTFVTGPYYGTTVLGVNVAFTSASGAVTLPFRCETWTSIYAEGTSGTAITQGYLTYGTTLTAVTTIPVPGIALATVTIDTTAATSFTHKCTCSSSSSSNIWNVYQWLVEVMNFTP